MGTRLLTKSLLSLALAITISSCSPSKSTQDSQIASSTSQNNILGGAHSTDDFQKKNGIVGLLKVVVDSEGNQGMGICTGSLIAKNVVLTAAHCLAKQPNEKIITFFVFFGLNVDEILEEVIVKKDLSRVRPIDAVLINSEFGKKSIVKDKTGADVEVTLQDNDIGLVRFKGLPVENFELTQLAAPDVAQTLSKNTEITVAGFGVSSFTTDPITKEAVPQSDNLLRYVGGIKLVGMTENEIGADETHGTGTCQGDSGGPAFITDAVTQKNTLIGITSRGSKGCQGIGIYTSVMAQSAWIANNLVQISN